MTIEEFKKVFEEELLPVIEPNQPSWANLYIAKEVLPIIGHDGIGYYPQINKWVYYYASERDGYKIFDEFDTEEELCAYMYKYLKSVHDKYI